MKKRFFAIGIAIIALFFGNAYSQTETTNVKKVAILDVVDRENNVEYGAEFVVRMNLSDAINKTPGYEAYTRVNMKEIFGELDFQRSGYVSDDQIKAIGKQTGAEYILISEATNISSTEIAIGAQLILVETGRITNSTQGEFTKWQDKNDIKNVTASIISQLLGASSSSNVQGRVTRYSNSNTLSFTVKGVNFTMIKVQGGRFRMGCTAEQGGECYNDESPVHSVNLSDYYIGETEVTQELWQAVMGTNPSNFKGANRPVEMVSWNDCQAFIGELNAITGKTFMLPTEAQWEYAARGGNKNQGYKYSGSNYIDAVAWYTDNSGSATHPVKQKRANELGIYDMSGNVWEWCSDWYGNYGGGEQNDPTGAYSGSYRVLRGGSWSGVARGCRVANRDSNTPGIRNDNIGFRVVLLP